jgi:cation diffusion facilitator family transporter
VKIQKTKLTAAWISVLSNTFLIIAKLMVGIIINSVSVISEAIHSGADLLASGIAVMAVWHSEKPADKNHPYGHGKAENISGTIEAVLILIAAAWIIFEASTKLIRGGVVENAMWGIGVMLASSIINFIVSKYLFRIAQKTDSVALEADAWHLRTDVYTSAGVFSGLGLIWIGEEMFPGRHFHWINPAAAIIVALLIIHTAWELIQKSAKDLLDRALPVEEENWIREYIKNLNLSVFGCHYLRTRKAGSFRFVDFHIQVDGKMTVEASHALTDEITAAIQKHLPRASITIHTEPCNGSCKPNCISGCFLTAKQREMRYSRKI